MQKKKGKVLIIIVLIFLLVFVLLVRALKLWPTTKKTFFKGKKLDFNVHNITSVINGTNPNFGNLTVGKWYCLTYSGQFGPVYKLSTTQVLMSRTNGLSGVQYRSLYCYTVSGTTATLLKNANVTINGTTYKTNSSGQLYTTNGNGYISLGDYNVQLVAKDNNSAATNWFILRNREWIRGISYWRFYDAWGLNNNNSQNQSFSRRAISATPNTLYSIANGNYTLNSVTRKIHKININDVNASVADYPFTFDISNDTTYNFWYGSAHTPIGNEHIYDALGDRHLVWAEYNNKAEKTTTKYVSGNIGFDLYNVGSYMIEEGGKTKKVIVNLRSTFYWQDSDVLVPYQVGSYTLNKYPAVLGFRISPAENRFTYQMFGLPYRVHITFYYSDNTGEHELNLSGSSFGFDDVDAGQYFGFKVNDGATIQELQCIDNTYAWTGTNGETGNGSINYFVPGLSSMDGSGIYDVVGANIFENASNVTPPPTNYLSNHPNYYNIASRNGFESLITYNVKNINSVDLIIGGAKKDEASVRYFDTIFDIPNTHTQIVGDIHTALLDEYVLPDSQRDALGDNSQLSIGEIGMRGVRLGRNAIPSPTLSLKDENEGASSEIYVNTSSNGPNLSPYYEEISIKIPYENQYTYNSTNYDNFYDSFKIEQQLDSNITVSTNDVSIHYYGETDSLNSYFSITMNNTQHKLTIQANNNGANSIYKKEEFYGNELIIEVKLVLPAANNNIWDNEINSFTHTASLTITRNNSEYSGASNDNVTNTSNVATAKINIITIQINKNDTPWDNSNMSVALYVDNQQEYGYNQSTTLSNGTKVRWIGVDNGTYNIYASNNNMNGNTLVDTGKTISTSNNSS